MAHYLLDSNILLRALDKDSPHCELVRESVYSLLRAGEEVWLTPQVIVESWSVATRPADVNGLGLDVRVVERWVDRVVRWFPMLADTPAIFDNWLDLVRTHQVKGKKVHDARLVAVMKAHGVENLLTFNVEDFGAFQEIKAIHPASVT